MTRFSRFSFRAISMLFAVFLAGGLGGISVYAMQDLGDNDQDGIANYLDPDDDNDGVADELDYAPFDPQVQNPPTETDPTPTPTSAPVVPPVENEPENPAAPTTDPPAVVTGLPETGTGRLAPGILMPLAASVLLCTLALVAIEKRIRIH